MGKAPAPKDHTPQENQENSNPTTEQDLFREWHDQEVDAKDRALEKQYREYIHEREQQAARNPNRSFFRKLRDVIVVPGFMASELHDLTGGYGLVWIDPLHPTAMAKLALNPLDDPLRESESDNTVQIVPKDPPTGLYTNLYYNLRYYDCNVMFFPVDWRKNLEVAANRLAQQIQARQASSNQLFLVAHSQGALVARRALQILGGDAARRLVQHLVLLGPANAGTFSAVTAVAGSHSFLDLADRLHRDPGPEFLEALKTFSGLYQLFPYNRESQGQQAEDRYKIDFLRNQDVREEAFWNKLGVSVDTKRLTEFRKWSYDIDTNFFADRMTIILGNQPTAGGVMKNAEGKLVPDPQFSTVGDGTVPDAMARLPNVQAYRAPGASHMWLGMNPTVVETATSVILGRQITIPSAGRGFAQGKRDEPITLKPWVKPTPPPQPKQLDVGTGNQPGWPTGTAWSKTEPTRHYTAPGDLLAPEPTVRRLRVYSFDPVMGRALENVGSAVVCIGVAWDGADGSTLQPGPVGEYIEVVDVDPASQCVYPPVDLNDPNLLAQDGMPPSEGHPWFHQQMVYAVAMKTIEQFEIALGRRALWSPRIVKDDKGDITSEYVPRLRIYPHAVANANAYYDPVRKALLFGYFQGGILSSNGTAVGEELVFAALSYDIIAHETSHALLDGLHRHLNKATNPDVFAFHEAFADIVALFQHFSHPEVLQEQLGKSHGDLRGKNELGGLAMQFGQAMGERGGAMRQYIGELDENKKWKLIPPDPTQLAKITEPHARGAILVAAVFHAFLNIYENRIKDLKRIATGGSGILPDGDLHPDLVNRLANEASKAAQHLLRMCIRALDYIPPTDITFGEYLRALITADYDLIKNDDRHYRVAVLEAFRDWGIMPKNVRTLSVDSLLWDIPANYSLRNLSDILQGLDFDSWDRQVDRQQIYFQMQQNREIVHERMDAMLRDDDFHSLGIIRDASLRTIDRSKIGRRRPKFDVHSIRPCRRIGPNNEYRWDIIVELVQKRKGYLNVADQDKADDGDATLLADPDFMMYGGCTLIIEPKSGDIRYCLRKRTPPDNARIQEMRDNFLKISHEGRAFNRDEDNQPFRALHQH